MAGISSATTSPLKASIPSVLEDEDKSSTVSDEIRRADSKTAELATRKALVITVSGELKERGDTIVLFSGQQKSLKNMLDMIRKARDDKEVRTVVFRFTASELGLAMAQEVRQAIEELRAQGKKTIGIVEDDSQVSYLAASACEQVVIPPSADLMLYGVKADAYFLRGLLDKVGVHAQVIHVGKYKSYGEMFTQDDFTTPARENMAEIVDDIYSQLVQGVASSRKLSPDKVEETVNRGPLSAEEAQAAGLADRIAYSSDILAELKSSGLTIVDDKDYSKDAKEKSDDLSLLGLLSMMSKDKAASDRSSKYPQVAVVYAVGPIMLGSRQGVSLTGGEEEIYSDDLIQVLDEIQKDKKIKAVIVRINSPGGSAFASDLIWKKMEELKKAKPVVVSMGDVAASGGYYIAMGAQKIIAEPGTLTGSIGVVGGKVNLSGGYHKLGISKTTISKGSYATLFSETSDFSPQERELVERMMLRTYDGFVSKAAQGRKLPKDQLDGLAQGKVWSGARAKSVGLVDDVGGMGRAIEEAKLLIGLKKDDKVALVPFPKEVSLFDLLQKAFGTNAAASLLPVESALPVELRQVLTWGRTVMHLFERERVLAIMPFVPEIQ